MSNAMKTPETVADVLEKVTGISKEEQRKLLLQVVENRKRLDACAGPHLFSPMPEQTTLRLAREWTCVRCGGRVSLFWVAAYRRGIIHAGGDPAAVTTVTWPGT